MWTSEIEIGSKKNPKDSMNFFLILSFGQQIGVVAVADVALARVAAVRPGVAVVAGVVGVGAARRADPRPVAVGRRRRRRPPAPSVGCASLSKPFFSFLVPRFVLFFFAVFFGSSSFAFWFGFVGFRFFSRRSQKFALTLERNCHFQMKSN